MKKHGALPARTQATSLTIHPKTEELNDREVFVGTDVSRTVDATFDSADKLRDLLSELDTSDELIISVLDANRSDEVAIKDDLRRRAIADSQQSARQIAKAYGMKIKGVYSVSQVAPSYSYGISESEGLASVSVIASALPELALSVGTIELEQNIYAVYLAVP